MHLILGKVEELSEVTLAQFLVAIEIPRWLKFPLQCCSAGSKVNSGSFLPTNFFRPHHMFVIYDVL